MYNPSLRVRNLFFLLVVTVVGLFTQSGWATPIITALVETGGDNEATDTIAAQYSIRAKPFLFLWPTSRSRER
jgi:hypothetical protein